jgi:hypothetical protein
VDAQVTALDYDQGPIGLGLALRHLPNDGSVLMVTAHPDDENNGLLVKLSRGLGVKTSLLTVTRGDGGQNEIGPELFQAIGILRSEELAAVHRSTAWTSTTPAPSSSATRSATRRRSRSGGANRSSRTSSASSAASAGRDRDDVAPGQSGGGQHHQASAQLGHEAFHAAADPARFPDQIKEG